MDIPSLRTAFLLLLVAAWSGGRAQEAPSSPAPARPPPRVKLNKCCHMGEYLNETTRSCNAGSPEQWVPMVYMVQQQRFFEPVGGSPRFMKFLPHSRPQCQDQYQELFRSRTTNQMLFPNGSLYVRERGLFVEPQNYCVDWQVALICLDHDKQQPQPSNGDPDQSQSQGQGQEQTNILRLRKCCGKYGSYDTQKKDCDLQLHNPPYSQLRLEPQLPVGSYETIYGLPYCSSPGGYAIAGDWTEAKLNRSDRHLQLPHTNLSADHYCLEHTQREGEVKIIACQYLFSPELYDPHLGPGEIHANLQNAFLTASILVSIVFLAATLVAGFMLPTVHHALHWRCQICYIFCLLVGKVLLAIEEFSTSLEPGTAWCLILAISMQFFFLAAFFWLNTMCFNIWWTFRDFRPSSLERSQEALRLVLYSLYAWGGPLLIVFVAACVDQLPETSLLRPGFGQVYCWFDNSSLSIFAYFYGPIGLLLCANIVLFLSTTHQLTCGLWKRDDVKSSTEKSALGRVCLKLVVVMGVTWIADIISWVVGGPNDAWFATDMINALQGVFIFIVVGCQPQVWTACRRICCPRLRHDITNTTNGVQHSSSSQGLPSMAGGTEFTQNTSMPSSPAADSGFPEDTPTDKATPGPGPGPGPGTPPSPVSAPPKMETIC